jgi:hypothetical protein
MVSSDSNMIAAAEVEEWSVLIQSLKLDRIHTPSGAASPSRPRTSATFLECEHLAKLELELALARHGLGRPYLTTK